MPFEFGNGDPAGLKACEFSMLVSPYSTPRRHCRHRLLHPKSCRLLAVPACRRCGMATATLAHCLAANKGDPGVCSSLETQASATCARSTCGAVPASRSSHARACRAIACCKRSCSGSRISASHAPAAAGGALPCRSDVPRAGSGAPAMLPVRTRLAACLCAPPSARCACRLRMRLTACPAAAISARAPACPPARGSACNSACQWVAMASAPL